MRKVIVAEFLSLDGVMEDPGGAEGFEHGGWQIPYFVEDMGKAIHEGLYAADALLLGRVTYQHFAAAWPSMTDEFGFADRMNGIPKFVASRTLDKAEWNATLIKGDVADEVAKLKQQPGQALLVLGSGDLAQTLMQHNLVDEYQLMIHPVVLGSGKRLFRDGSGKTGLKLVDSKTTSSGVLILTYQPASDEGEGAAAGEKE